MGVTKIILVKDVDNLGEEGDVKDVKKGYARNFLIPNGLAVDYSIKNRNDLERKKAELEKKRKEKRDNATALKDKLSKEVVEISFSAGDKGRLYGTVTNLLVAEEINKKGYSIDRKMIDLKEHIKFAGKYKVSAHIYQDIYAEFDLVVNAASEDKKSDKKDDSKKRRKKADDEVEASAE